MNPQVASTSGNLEVERPERLQQAAGLLIRLKHHAEHMQIEVSGEPVQTSTQRAANQKTQELRPRLITRNKAEELGINADGASHPDSIQQYSAGHCILKHVEADSDSGPKSSYV